MFGVVIPVGPGERELTRLAAVVTELGTHERADEIALWVIDDAPSARDIAVQWPHLNVIRTQIRENGTPDLFSAHVAGTLEGLAAVREAGLEFAVKLDTDVAIVNPFSAQLRDAFVDRGLGVVGSYDRTSAGGVRDWTLWRAQIDAASRPLALRRSGRGIDVRYRPASQRRFIRAQRQAAYETAPPGAHCLGGAYAVSSAFLDGAALDWQPWIASRLGEDVTVGLLCSAAGLRMASLTAAGEPFALAWRGLPASPEQIAAGGHAIVHSVKADSPENELAMRAVLQRATAAARSSA